MGLKTYALITGLLLTAIAPLGAAAPLDDAANGTQSIERDGSEVEWAATADLIKFGEPTAASLADVSAWLSAIDPEGRSTEDFQALLTQRGFGEEVTITDAFLDGSSFLDEETLALALDEANLANVDTTIVDEVIALLEALMENIDVKAKTVICSGGGSTIMGWADYAHVAGMPVHVQNSPASSHYRMAVNVDEGEILWADGHSRSAMDNIVWEYDDATGIQKVYWDWNSIPMGGQASLGGSCTYVGSVGILTSVNSGASGTPLGLPTSGILEVSAGGTTCLVPC